MKIAIIGYSGSGKSTLAQTLGKHYHLPVLHLDKLRFTDHWQTRPDDLVLKELKEFIDQHDNWIIDGNYSFALFKERMEQADRIIFMNFPRFTCLWRASKRYLTYRGQVRESMAANCPEKFDREFIRWILWDGRTTSIVQNYRYICQQYSQKVIILRHQKQVDHILSHLFDC